MSDSPVWVHPKTAAKYGIKTGDKIFLQNKFSKDKATVFVTEGIREDTLFLYHGFGHVSAGLKRVNGVGTNQSKLLDPSYGEVCSTMVTNVGVDIVKA